MDALQKQHARAGGRTTAVYSNLGYSAEFERSICGFHIHLEYRNTLQNNDGSFRFAEDPLGTGAQIPGRYYVNSFSKKVPY